MLKNREQLWDWIIKIYNFQATYLFDEDWGTELDWRRNLEPTTPDNNALIYFVKLLLTNKILIKNKTISKCGCDYVTYKLNRDYKKKLKLEIIEQTAEYKFFESIYDIYNK